MATHEMIPNQVFSELEKKITGKFSGFPESRFAIHKDFKFGCMTPSKLGDGRLSDRNKQRTVA